MPSVAKNRLAEGKMLTVKLEYIEIGLVNTCINTVGIHAGKQFCFRKFEYETKSYNVKIIQYCVQSGTL
jgi:hypothetical protein